MYRIVSRDDKKIIIEFNDEKGTATWEYKILARKLSFNVAPYSIYEVTYEYNNQQFYGIIYVSEADCNKLKKNGIFLMDYWRSKEIADGIYNVAFDLYDVKSDIAQYHMKRLNIA